MCSRLHQDTAAYGIVDATSLEERVSRVNAIVEKPKPEEAPSTLGVVGRYILTPRIFHHIQNLKPGAGGELQLTDAIAALLKNSRCGLRVRWGALRLWQQARRSTGDGRYALKYGEVKEEFGAYLKNRVC